MLRSITTYILLVGLPLVGLVGVLRAGQTITPPPSVGGRWAIEANEALRCVVPASDAQLVIEQSGAFLQVGVGGITIPARLRAHEFEALSVMPSGPCEGARIRFVGSFAKEATTLSGHLRLDCSSCSGGSFTAHRVTP